jgi:hypothetical protein
MPHVDPADLEFRGAVSVDVTELHDAVLRQLGAWRDDGSPGEGAEQ